MTDLKELLTAISDHAGVFDVTERAFVLGRRRRTRQRVAFAGATTALAVTALLVAVNLPAGPAPEPAIPPSPSASLPAVALSACTVANLPLPDGVRKEQSGVSGDHTGRILASRLRDDRGDVLVVWADGQPAGVVRWPDEAAEISAVGPTGIVLMAAEQGTGGAREKSATWVYRDGTVTRLRGKGALGRGVNAAGAIVGLISDNQPVVWPDATAEPVPLPVPDGMTAADPMGIADDGTVVGQLFQGRHGPKPAYQYGRPGWGYVWPPGGSPEQLSVPDKGPGAGATQSRAFGVVDGWAAGNIQTLKGPSEPVRWNLATGEVELIEGAERVTPHGWSIFRNGRSLTLVRGDVEVPLPGPPGYPSPSVGGGSGRTYVYVISPDGRALAGMQDDGPARLALLRWTCR
ncbi:hypothetical protein AB0B31_02520 [Catellatospora citrea]|uniref:hypothetical protein n=1 Tax=Catellatospora citrea TaxID=53366 RepID=UPI00340C84E3